MKGATNGIGTRIFLFAVGAIMRFAVSVQVRGFNLHTIGVVLMLVGALGIVLSMFFWHWQSWGGFHRGGRRGTVVSEQDTIVRDRGVL
jgi:hypothetical protein